MGRLMMWVGGGIVRVLFLSRRDGIRSSAQMEGSALLGKWWS